MPSDNGTPVPSDKRALAEALMRLKGKRVSRWSEADKRKIFGALLGGAHAADVGAEYGVSAQTIKNLVKRAIKEGMSDGK